MTDSMKSGIVFVNVGLLCWLPLALLARVAEALSSGRQLWSRGSAGAAVWKCDKDVVAPSELLIKELWVAQDGKLKFIWRGGKI